MRKNTTPEPESVDLVAAMKAIAEAKHISTDVVLAALREAIDSGVLPHTVVEGEHVVCFYSLQCRFCKMSARKLMPLRERGDFSQAPIIAIIGQGENTDTAPFLEETGFRPDEAHFIAPSDFLRITNGSMPLILVMQDSTVTGKFNYRNLH